MTRKPEEYNGGAKADDQGRGMTRLIAAPRAGDRKQDMTRAIRHGTGKEAGEGEATWHEGMTRMPEENTMAVLRPTVEDGA